MQRMLRVQVCELDYVNLSLYDAGHRYVDGIFVVFGISFLISCFSCLALFFCLVTGCTGKNYLLRKHLFHCRNCIRYLSVESSVQHTK